MSKVNYVCATCGQDFTRRYSANRHNNHFHFGNGIIVRFLEYIIGRTNGRFPPLLLANNNLSTRISRKWWHNNDNSSSPFNGNNGLRDRNNGRFTTIPDQTGDVLGCGTVGQSVNSNSNVSKDVSKITPSPYNISPPLPSPSLLSDKPAHTKQSDIFEQFQQRISRLAEIKTLLTPYLSYQDICYLLKVLNIQCISSGNTYFLDQMLILVRQTVKFRQDLDQLLSPDPPLYMNNNNNLAATPRANSLMGNNRFIAQNSYQMYPHYSPLPPPPPPPPILQQQPLEQRGQIFHPIFFYTLVRPPKSLD